MYTSIYILFIEYELKIRETEREKKTKLKCRVC